MWSRSTYPQLGLYHSSEKGFIDMLGTPEIGNVRRSDGKALGPSLPGYIVRSASYRGWKPAQSIKIIDFGESLLYTATPKKLHIPLPLQAPEVIIQDHIDYRVDLWSMGCMVSGVIRNLKIHTLAGINTLRTFYRPATF
jgi:serine/threonine protein kinase